MAILAFEWLLAEINGKKPSDTHLPRKNAPGLPGLLSLPSKPPMQTEFLTVSLIFFS